MAEVSRLYLGQYKAIGLCFVLRYVWYVNWLRVLTEIT